MIKKDEVNIIISMQWWSNHPWPIPGRSLWSRRQWRSLLNQHHERDPVACGEAAVKKYVDASQSVDTLLLGPECLLLLLLSSCGASLVWPSITLLCCATRTISWTSTNASRPFLTPVRFHNSYTLDIARISCILPSLPLVPSPAGYRWPTHWSRYTSHCWSNK